MQVVQIATHKIRTCGFPVKSPESAEPPSDMYALQGWGNYHMAHQGLIAMFGATPGMTEAELIDFIADNRKRANTYEELQEDGTIIIRSSKTMQQDKRDKMFPEQRIVQRGPGRTTRTTDHPDYAAMLDGISELEEVITKNKLLQ